MSVREYHHDKLSLIYDEDVFRSPDAARVDYDYWRQAGAITGQAQGRGAAIFVDYADHKLVIRQYRRGGLMARVSEASYLWTGWQHTRCYREFRLLQTMRELGLPVPEPIAAEAMRRGLWYQAALVTRQIPDCKTLAGSLLNASLDEAQWREIGRTLACFHNAGIDHADLNAHNILLDSAGAIFVLDFDKGIQQQQAGPWQKSNLQRLYRSLQKLHSQHNNFHFSEANWQHLQAAYREILIAA